MKTFLSLALAAATIGGALAATSVPAAAQGHDHGGAGHGGGAHYSGGRYGGGRYGGGWGGYRYHGGWAGGWYGPYGYGWGPDCYSVWQWDPYSGRDVPVTVCN